MDANDLSISVTQGEIKLNNVEVKSSAFDDLELPITIKSDTVGQIHIKLSWTKLTRHRDATSVVRQLNGQPQPLVQASSMDFTSYTPSPLDTLPTELVMEGNRLVSVCWEPCNHSILQVLVG